jgi:hypothetical protein
MSSILDALKKLESEKSGKERPVEHTNIEAVAAERDLTHRRRNQPDGELIRINSMVLILGGLAVVGVLVAVSAVAALVIVQTTERRRVADAVSPVAAPLTPTAPFQPVPVADTAPAVPSPVPLKPVSSEPAVADEAVPVPPIESVAPVQEPVAWIEPDPAVVAGAENAVPMPTATQRRAPAATIPPAPARATPPTEEAYVEAPIGDVDLTTLPVLSESERIRLGLPSLKINIVGLPTKRQPRPSALINFEKVYLGEYIKNTKARLIAVELRGVGIEVAGHRYFMEK